jgi:UDP-GlcNAc:undecaprenyl-phosphate/decaprenyl-phosphate GlcNAc-1-phosphate transferase
MFFHTDLLHIVLASGLGFVIAVAIIPPVLKVARCCNLFDTPSDRKIHTCAIPPLGGIAIFLGFVLSSIVASHLLDFYPLKYIIAATILVFFIGLKDDLITVAPRKKFAVQIVAVLLLIYLGNVQLTNLHGLMGFHEIHPVFSIPLTLFVFLAIINAFNLIDGIDGLAAGLAMMVTFILGSWFFISGYLQQAILAFALTGSLAGFFLFNVFGNTNKLFMGDTGSLVIGLIAAVLVVKFNQLNIDHSVPFAVGAAPSVSFAVVAIPLVDMLRVMTIRIMAGKSPFYPDKNHIHHRLLEFYPSHLTVTLIMVATNASLVGLALLMNRHMKSITLQFFMIFLLGVLLSFVPSHLLKMRRLKQNLGNLVVQMPKLKQVPIQINMNKKKKKV